MKALCTSTFTPQTLVCGPNNFILMHSHFTLPCFQVSGYWCVSLCSRERERERERDERLLVESETWWINHILEE